MPTVDELSLACKSGTDHPVPECAAAIAKTIVGRSKECFDKSSDEAAYNSCARNFCGLQCGSSMAGCLSLCVDHSLPLFSKFEQRVQQAEPSTTAAPVVTTVAPLVTTVAPLVSTAAPVVTAVAPSSTTAALVVAPSTDEAAPSDAPAADEEQMAEGSGFAQMDSKQLMDQAHDAASEEESAMADLQAAQERMRRLNVKIEARGEKEIKNGNAAHGKMELAKVAMLTSLNSQINEHLANVAQFKQMARSGSTEADEEPVPADGGLPPMGPPDMSFLQRGARSVRR